MGPVLELREASKSYGSIEVLHSVSLAFEPGTITSIVGENGAGKSTFIKLVAGAEKPTAGSVLIDGRPLPADPGEAISAGINVIYQELTDIRDMPVVDNVLLGRQPARVGLVNQRASVRQAAEALNKVGLHINDLGQPIGQLTLAQRQLAEIARCLARETRVLVLDEPTSSLHEREVRQLLDTLVALKDQGMSIIFVSHHLDEVLEISDRIAVLRDGSLVESGPVGEYDEHALVRAMLGRTMEGMFPYRPRPLGDVALRVSGLSGRGFTDASLDVRRGEIVGVVGLDGAGHEGLLRSIGGAEKPTGGSVSMSGTALPPGDLLAARRAGLVYGPRDRKFEGIVPIASVNDNLIHGLYRRVAKWGWLDLTRWRKWSRQAIREYEVSAPSGGASIESLSGGNQQKVVIARAMGIEPKAVILDDPTRGVDVGARAAIHEKVLRMAEDGVAVLFTSSDSDEVFEMADRILVMRSGAIVRSLDRGAYEREAVLHLMTA